MYSGCYLDSLKGRRLYSVLSVHGTRRFFFFIIIIGYVMSKPYTKVTYLHTSTNFLHVPFTDRSVRDCTYTVSEYINKRFVLHYLYL